MHAYKSTKRNGEIPSPNYCWVELFSHLFLKYCLNLSQLPWPYCRVLSPSMQYYCGINPHSRGIGLLQHLSHYHSDYHGNCSITAVPCQSFLLIMEIQFSQMYITSALLTRMCTVWRCRSMPVMNIRISKGSSLQIWQQSENLQCSRLCSSDP